MATSIKFLQIKTGFRASGLVFVFGLFFSGLGSVNAANWVFVPEITINEIFTDNLRLAPDGFEESDLVTAITPGFTLSGLSRRYEFNLNYNLQNLFYKNNSDLNESNNLLQADGTGEILEDRFFLDLSATSSQQNVSRDGVVALDNISQSGGNSGLSSDRGSVQTYSISPYWQQRIGNYADVEARYEFNEVKSEDSFDSEANNIFITATNGSYFNRLLWGVTFENRDIENENDINSTEFRTLFADVEYLLTRKFALKAEVGYDDNEFASDDTDISGERWRVGGVWRPSSRTSLEALAGRRFFGTDIFVEFMHRTRKTEWLVNFQQTPDTTRSTLLNQQVFTNTDIFGVPIDPVTGQQALLNVNNPAQTAEVLIRERLNAAVNYTLRRNIFNLTLFYEKRDFQLSSEEESKGVDVSWEWLLGPRTTSDLGFIWSDDDFRSGEETQFYITQYQLTHTFGNTLQGNIGFRRVDRESSIATREYTEHRVFIGVQKVF